MLSEVLQHIPDFYPFLAQCYYSATNLSFGEFIIHSQSGVQQGDPFGPVLFCLVLQPLLSLFESEFNMWYLDDGTLADDFLKVLQDLKLIIAKSKDLGLQLNFKKCELIIFSEDVEVRQNIYSQFESVASGIKLMDFEVTSLLGCPLSTEGLEQAISAKTMDLERMSEMLLHLTSHTAYFLLKNSIGIPKLNYILRCCPTWRCMNELLKFDSCLKSSLEAICNTNFDDTGWSQSSLPVSIGGLGILCYSAFLGSIHLVAEKMKHILPSYIYDSPDGLLDEALDGWTTLSGLNPIEQSLRPFQSFWDSAFCGKIFA